MTEKEKKNRIIQLTSSMMHQYYCENQQESVIELLDESFCWIGVGEQEYVSGKENAVSVFSSFFGKMIRCKISNEEYQVMPLGDQVYICSGRMWITAEPSVKACLQVHQRVTAAFRFEGERAVCCHMHMSNPYIEMAEDEVGFPFKTSLQTYEYLQRLLKEQEVLFQKREKDLQQIYYQDSLTQVYNRNRFDKDMNSRELQKANQLGIGYFDVNNLKKINDTQGHSAGDRLICRVAEHIRKYFEHKTYRIGGDEFVVIDTERDRENFENVMRKIGKNMKEDQIDCSQGFCWRSQNIHMMEQFNEADHKMYKDKKEYYKQKAEEES